MLRLSILCFGLLLLSSTVNFAQSNLYPYEPSPDHPFGLPNPDAPPELLDFAPLIGECECESTIRNPDQSWAETVPMIWRFKYIMNGMGVQDETFKPDGFYAGSIRQFIADSSRWYVHYYSSLGPTSVLPSWEGNATKDNEIILYREQKAPNGMDGFYKITFANISAAGFSWLGEWVKPDESIKYPTWKIECTKKREADRSAEREQILANIKAFSQAYINGDYDALVGAYTEDGKIFPGNTDILAGQAAIKEYWVIKDGSKVLDHQVAPEEIQFIGDYAYDYGRYSGRTQRPDGNTVAWQGKYVIVWKRIGEDWKIYLDIWNRIAN